MRQLTKKQKNILDKWMKENCPLAGLALCDVVEDYLPNDLWEELQRINNTEILWQEVNRYVNDNCMKYDTGCNPHFRNLGNLK
tara:strand:- start:264 stop:512 length:249 start_codon:yes stop_codon:yes gene_type:complete